jgi:hypothetical protein
MDDSTIMERINAIAEEEERLWASASDGGLSDDDRARLHELQVQLDQAYDFLNQRRARRAAGLDPDKAEIRPPEIVEHYQQ